ncbi:hypothetical protein HFP43_07740 [Streptomyces sp. SJ1-7]|nr:hypothetical protein [Streptomyces sp. SJ1-7]
MGPGGGHPPRPAAPAGDPALAAPGRRHRRPAPGHGREHRDTAPAATAHVGRPAQRLGRVPQDLTAELDRLLIASAPESEALARFRFTDESDSDHESTESDPADDPRTWAGLLFGPASRGEYEAEALLDTARAVRDLAHRATASRAEATDVLAELRELTRQVLGLGGRARIGARELMMLGSLALSATPRQLADTGALARLLTHQDAALGEQSRLAPDRGPGRDWTGTGGQTPRSTPTRPRTGTAR